MSKLHLEIKLVMRKLSFYYRLTIVVWALFKAKLFKRRVPVKVAISITKHCNLQCVHCYSDKTNDAQEKEPSIKDLKKLIDTCYENGCRWVYFLGGEPVMKKGIGELIHHARNKGMLTEMNTNGHFVIRNYETIKEIDFLTFSLDGDREAHDALRGKGSFDQVMAGIIFAKDHFMNVRIHAVLTKLSQGSLAFFQNIYETHGVMYNFSDFESDNPSLAKKFSVSSEERRNFYLNYLELASKKKGIYNSLKGIRYVLDWPFSEPIATSAMLEKSKFKHVPCQHTVTLCVIDTDGSMHPCIGLWNFGKNVYTDGFKEAWDYLQNVNCKTCRDLGSVETSMYLSLDAEVLKTGFVNLLGSKTKKRNADQNQN